MNALIATEDEYGEPSDTTACRILLAHMLRQAVTDYHVNPGTTNEDSLTAKVDASEWLFDSDEILVDDDGITFAAVCQYLSLDPGSIRSQIKSQQPGL